MLITAVLHEIYTLGILCATQAMTEASTVDDESLSVYHNRFGAKWMNDNKLSDEEKKYFVAGWREGLSRSVFEACRRGRNNV